LSAACSNIEGTRRISAGPPPVSVKGQGRLSEAAVSEPRGRLHARLGSLGLVVEYVEHEVGDSPAVVADQSSHVAGEPFRPPARVAADTGGKRAPEPVRQGGETAASSSSWACAAFTAPTMPLLALAKRRIGSKLNSSARVKEGAQNMVCAYLSVALLVGLLANALAGWWWADPAAALVIAAVALREGRESWRGEGCCDTC
jgi:hypothetical protein